MTADPTAVRVGYAGKAYVAAEDTAGPTTLTGVWPTGYVDLGLISDDGLTEAMDQDRNEWTPWGYDSPVRTQVKGQKRTFKLTFWETNASVLSLYHSVAVANMTTTGTGTGQYLSFAQGQNTAPDVRALGLDIVDADRTFRYVINRCEVTDRDDIVYKGDEVVAYTMTFTALLDADGVSITRYYGRVALPS